MPWGNAGAYTLIAELVPDEDRVTGNALLSTFNQASYVVGPALAGGLTAWAGPGWVIAADSVLITVVDDGNHTIYAKGHPCVEQIANAWLIGGVLPHGDVTCPGHPAPASGPGDAEPS
jgi:MFS family permease